MLLQRLEIHGFKTFANPTTLEFSPGITAIVGPNGSGKSNVSDAILWGLGEHNVRNLRGGKLHDVIFAGSTARRPTGLAEVAITFDNGARSLPLDYNEVTVTRRVYRSEESECFINRTACRLRDIVDLFLDSGIGRESYFALNQGEIDMVLSVNPDERRALFEEAAGIRKYRVRKRESLRKLEATEANLVRICDLLAEVEARIGPLQRQAEAARRYQDLRAKLEATELAAFAADWGVLAQRMRHNTDRLEGARAQSAAVESELSGLAASEERVRLELNAADESLETVHRQHEQLVHDRAQTEARCRVLQERISAVEAAADAAAARFAEIGTERQELEAAITAHREDLTIVGRQLQDLGGSISAARQSVTASETRLRACTLDVERAQARAIENATRAARLQSSREEAARRLEALSDQIRNLIENQSELDGRQEALSLRREELGRMEAAAKSEALARQEEVNRLAANAGRLHADLRGWDENLRARERELAGDTSRLRLLEELQEQREGFYKGVRAILQAASAGKLAGHYRPIADILSMDRAHEAAIEAALGSSVQDIVTRTDEEARQGIYFLKRTGAGRATFLPLEMVSRLARGGPMPSARGIGVLGIASDLVRYEDLYRPVIEMLLGRVVVCDTLENASEATRTLSHWSRLVTLDGEVVSGQGAMTGGSRQQTRASLVGRASQIADLRTGIAFTEQSLEELHAGRNALQQELSAIQHQQAEIEQARQESLTQQTRRARDADHLSQESLRLDRDRRALESALERAQAQEAAEAASLDRLNNTPAAGPDQEDTPEVLAALRARVEEAAAERDRLREELSGLLAREAGLRERRKVLAPGMENARSRLDRLNSEDRLLHIQDREKTESRVQFEAEAQALQEQIVTMDLEMEKVKTDLKNIRTAREAALSSLEALSDRTRVANITHQEIDRQIYTLQSEAAGLQTERDRIRAVLAEDYNIPPRPISSPGDDEPASPIESPAAAVSTFSHGPDREEADIVERFLSAISPSAQPDKDRQLAARLRRQVRALEPVNLDAIDEAVTVAERLAFLRQQQEDIEAAAQDLKAVIRKIDVEARDRFLETFQAISVQFEELFRQLFGGGQTRLALTEPDNPVDSGIEISAQPPGKKLQNLQLLSGGERSLTAVALLFAMLRVRPIPFCIMDEVDAALDEANIGRFGEMLRDFARATQFIVITHNRGTMEVADRLYGVTMTEPGVSRILSVELRDLERTDDLMPDVLKAERTRA